jgi:predicted CopG family antitoxin
MGARAVVTIRLPAEIIEQAKRLKSPDESLNDVIVEAIEKEIRRRRGLKALESIREIREQVEAETGIHPSSVPFIRALRAGYERHG